MLSVVLDNVGKKFGREWIFRRVGLGLEPGTRLVILGGNGSGKSTLLQIIAGYITPNEGKVYFEDKGELIPAEAQHRHVSLASPYLQLPEDLTGIEIVNHLARFKPFVFEGDPAKVIEQAGLWHAKDKLLKQYSSGMKQRLKLALAILAKSDLLLLDEPASNLDAEAIQWYRQMIDVFGAGRTIVVCSNAVKEEYGFCDRQVSVMDYK
jgi:ABC-type multidrug transport system ATPase subunit